MRPKGPAPPPSPPRPGPARDTPSIIVLTFPFFPPSAGEIAFFPQKGKETFPSRTTREVAKTRWLFFPSPLTVTASFFTGGKYTKLALFFTFDALSTPETFLSNLPLS